MPGGASGAPGGSNPVRVAVIGSPQTGDEQVGDLDRVLDGSMVIFDGRILEEQQRARDARRGSESGAEGSVYGEESEGGSGATDVGEDGGMGGESGDGEGEKVKKTVVGVGHAGNPATAIRLSKTADRPIPAV